MIWPRLVKPMMEAVNALPKGSMGTGEQLRHINCPADQRFSCPFPRRLGDAARSNHENGEESR
jgi:hypothetical protein